MAHLLFEQFGMRQVVSDFIFLIYADWALAEIEMKKIIIALLVIAVVFYVTSHRGGNIIFIKKHTVGSFEIEYCPVLFNSSRRVVDFRFFPGEADANAISTSIGTLAARGEVVFFDEVENKSIRYKKSDMYRPYIWGDDVRVTMYFPWVDKCSKYKVLVEESFDEDLQISLLGRNL